MDTSSNKKATTVDCWSMFMDAFVLNQHIFNDKHFIAPLNRPDNSSFLPGPFSAPDAIPFVDIDGADPWYRNSRIADITKAPKARGDFSNLLRTERLGIYLHWTLPKEFRTSDASAQKPGDIDVSCISYIQKREKDVQSLTKQKKSTDMCPTVGLYSDASRTRANRIPQP